jgi:mRNA-decapping enzyme 1B
MAHGGGRAKVTPNLAIDGEGTRALNLTVLQRLDPAIEDILITTAHVTLYDFDTDEHQWVRAWRYSSTSSSCLEIWFIVLLV